MKYWDAFQNPVDTETGVTFTNMDNTSTGTITLTRTTLGVSTATQTVFTYAGNYTLSIAGITTIVGNTLIEVLPPPNPLPVVTGVLPLTAVAGVETAITLSGDNIQSDTEIEILVLSSSPLDPPEWRKLTVSSFTTTQITTTIPYLACVTAGTYQLRLYNPVPGGGYSTTAQLTVTPATVTQAEFSQSIGAIVANTTLPPIQVTFRDEFGNIVTDYSASVEVKDSTGAVVVTLPLSLGVFGAYQTLPTTLTLAGNYSFSVSGLTITGSSLIKAVTPSVAEGEDGWYSFIITYKNPKETPESITIIPPAYYEVASAPIEEDFSDEPLETTIQPNETFILYVRHLPGEPPVSSSNGTLNARPKNDEETQKKQNVSSSAPIVELSPNSPNPFSESTLISYTISEQMFVQLGVYNVFGRQVAVLAAGQHKAGLHNVNFKAGTLENGIYLLRLVVTTPKGQMIIKSQKIQIQR